ncbi:hypothetical protein SAMN05421594_4624 [Chryseobacterium oleae]|uniref:DUF3601 domain-containing protein n=1 Tax=Chryseobacterium oleae TaxID=491207 RepID=A0A1I5CSE0_CHROL|nr:hypothetical protein [Chryseobacterium oleae]SFN89571.1 hypothetical protein SAMN05421594_4624 [Chryseobacterium oleae]
MKRPYADLIGLTKKDLIKKMGDEFNFYPDTTWIYLLSKSFFGRKTYLIIHFEEEIVKSAEARKTYGNIYKTKL